MGIDLGSIIPYTPWTTRVFFLIVHVKCLCPPSTPPNGALKKEATSYASSVGNHLGHLRRDLIRDVLHLGESEGEFTSNLFTKPTFMDLKKKHQNVTTKKLTQRTHPYPKNQLCNEQRYLEYRDAKGISSPSTSFEIPFEIMIWIGTQEIEDHQQQTNNQTTNK